MTANLLPASFPAGPRSDFPCRHPSLQRQLREVLDRMAPADMYVALDSLAAYSTAGGAWSAGEALWDALADALGAPYASRQAARDERSRRHP